MRFLPQTLFLLLMLSASLWLTPLRAQTTPNPAAPTASAPAPSIPMPDLSGSGHGLDLTSMDTTAMPCQDLWRYANGKWLDAHPIPADRAQYGVDTEVYERNIAILHSILDTAAADTAASKTSDEYKVGTFYRTGMDTVSINAQGAKPLDLDFMQIAAVHDVPSLQAEIARLHREGAGPGFSFFVSQDAKNSTLEIAQLYQGGLGLPDRDYYTKTDAASKKTRAQYVIHIAKMLTLLGDSPAKSANEAMAVMAIETRLAKSSMTNVEQRDPNATYHKMTLAALDASTSGAVWDAYFTRIGIPRPGALNVAQPVFFKTLGAMLKTVPLSDWQTYLRWQTVDAAAPYLSAPFETEDFYFNRTVLEGVKKQQPRWKRVQAVTDGAIGEALGRLYVAKAFPPEAKARALALVNNLKSALDERLSTVDWMRDATKAKAREKLAAYTVKIGYPDKWRDYSKLSVGTDSYYHNVVRANEFEFQRNLNKLGKPVDRTEWGMTPPTVNAYYDPSMNEIVFPAGILQPPYFDPNADDAVNYGEAGATIGHEMTHGFDDSGRQFDAQGNLKNWWTATDAANFKVRSEAIVKQYDGYIGIGDMRINGELTQGENIADIGGLKIAYLAFHKAMETHPEPALLDGLTPDQRFFVAFAQSWREQTRPEAIRRQLLTDPHSPERFRVIGPTADMPEFAQAFQCPASEKLSATAATAGVW